MPVRFLPQAEPINIVGFTPDPDNPRPVPNELPELLERPFDWKIPDDIIGPILPCKHNFKQGCYQIALEPTGIAIFPLKSRFKGTMRVEHGSDHTIVSGDLYRFKGLRPVLTKADRIGGVFGGFFETAVLEKPPRIPIYPRKNYYSYLKVVDINMTRFRPPRGSCKITLTVEEYRYTHPAAGAATGSFPNTPDRVLTIVLRRTTNPAGYLGPSFEGDVYEGSTLLSYKFSMLWVSDFFRRASVELENVTGGALVSSFGANDFPSVYNTVGWNVTVTNGDANLAVPAGVSGTDPWSNAELHAFMVANRNVSTNLDTNWRVYYVAVPFDSSAPSGLFGIMFDQLDDEREGACNFVNNFSGAHNDNRARLRSACHEVGHAFNQQHPPVEGLASDNSIMSQSGPVKTVIEGAGGTYPDDINFAFNEHNRHHLIHSPDVVVRPGGEDFEFGHSIGFAPEATDNADAVGVQLRLTASTTHLKLGEPLTLKLEIKNTGDEVVPVPENIGTAFRTVEITVRKSGDEARPFRSFVMMCDGHPQQGLKPGQSVVVEEVVYWDREGCVFDAPGAYSIFATVVWEVVGQPFAAKADVDVFVDYPVSEADNAVAALLLNNEVGKYVALGGNAFHLKEAVARIKSASEIGSKHPSILRLKKIDDAGKGPRSTRVSKAGKKASKKK